MSDWAKDEIAKLGAAEEVQIAPRGRDGALREPVTVWAVRHADGIYVRSAVKGHDAAWFKGVSETRQGRIRAGRFEKDVTFTDDHDVDADVDAAYRAKYRRYAGRILNSVLTPEARSTTLKVMPRP